MPCSCAFQTSPLTITDGHHHIEPSLTSTCRSHLRARFPDRETAVGTIWAIQNYTIRYTSYGPPNNKLRLILDTVDWVGENHRSRACVDSLKPLLHSDHIASTLQQLHCTRVQEDDRCLRPQPKEEEDLHHATHTMAGADEPLDRDASMDTQMPFGTQVQHPARSPSNDDDVAFVGINRMEPVLAGSTQRAELKPRSANSAAEKQKHAQLLALLGKAQPPVAPQSQARNHANITPERTRSKEHTATSSPRPRQTLSKRASRERVEELVARPTQTPPDKGKKRMRQVETESPPTHRSAKKTSFSEDEPKQSRVCEMDKFAAECSWMKGLKLNRASSTVPDDQAYILQKPESWYKPQVGQRFPGANIPVQTLMVLSRMADEKAALEGATSSGSYHDTDPSSASYPPNSAPRPTDEQSSESDNEAPTSPVSWQTSPTPEPPQRPTPPRRGLPPDSSFEMPEHIADTAVLQSAVRRHQSPHPTLPASSHESEMDSPPSSPPTHQATKDSDDDMELETSVPQALGEDLEAPPVTGPDQIGIPRPQPRSRSVVQVEETPYIKGKNNQQPVVTISPPTQQSNEHLENSSSASIVQGTYQDLSSSAVEKTGKDNGRVQQDATGTNLHVGLDNARVFLENDAQDTFMFDMFVHEQISSDPTQQDAREKQTNNLPTQTIQGHGLAQPEPTPMSAQFPPKDSSSGEQAAPASTESASAMPVQPERESSRQPSATPSLTKRKPETTHPRERRRHKRLKVMSFSSGIRKSESERQQSSTSVESRQGSVSNLVVQDANPNMEDLDVKELVKEPTKEPIKPQADEANAAVQGDMSPRHQSLYATPSPILRPAAAPSAAAPITECISIDQPGQRAVEENATGQAVLEQAIEVQQPQAQPPPKSPPEPVSEPLSAPADGPAPVTLFEKFKAAYPQYTGSVKHFTNQCTRIEELDREDKMVPKWMWDDFIIRNQTDYRDYASECLDAGEEPMPYIRFYKDNIRDAVYKKGVIETRAVLLKALQELGVQPHTARISPPQLPVQQRVQQPSHRSPPPPVRQPTHVRQVHQQPSPQQPVQPSPRQPAQRETQSPMPPPARPAITPPKKKPSRKSLPFPVPNNSTPGRVNGTPGVRRSLPASSSRAAPAPTPASTPSARPAPSAHQKSKSAFGDTLRRSAADLPSSSLESGTGNEWRDWLRAQSRMTSTTGSRRVSSATPSKKDNSGNQSNKSES